MKTAYVQFGLPPVYTRKIEDGGSEGELKKAMEDRGILPVEAGIRTAGDLDRVVDHLRAENVSCLVICLKHWTRIALAVRLVRVMNLPTALYARTTGGFNGIPALTAVSAVLNEITVEGYGNKHSRFKEGMETELLLWLEAVAGYVSLRSSRLLCWGGHYGADMPYTRSDSDFLESRLVAEILTEQESVLTERAEAVLDGQPDRAGAFLSWLEEQGVTVVPDGKMITPETLRRQAALYLAARERLDELEGENIRGVSVKCHFELSTTGWGCTACFLPAFLPFSASPGGAEVPIIPTACEGDLNGLVSLVMLHSLRRDVPPLFGDFVEYNPDYVLLRNCGASSVYWAGKSPAAADSLRRVELLPNMHGRSGAAVHYETPEAAEVTAGRLFRHRGVFMMILGKGRVLAESRTRSYEDPWPHTRVDFGVDNDLLFETYPCNHGALTRGDVTVQLETVCRLADIPVIRMDSEKELEEWKRKM